MNLNKILPFNAYETQTSCSHLANDFDDKKNKNFQTQFQVQQGQLSENSEINAQQIQTQEEPPFDPDVIPPNFDCAQQHRKASQIGSGSKTPILTTTFCPCCARRVEVSYISLNCNLIELSFLGSGYPLYFTFIKFLTWVLTIMFLSSGMFNTIGGYTAQTNCNSTTSTQNSSSNNSGNEDVCNNNWINKFTLGDKKDSQQYITYQSGLNFFSIVLLVLLLHYFRYNQRKRNQDCDEKDIAANDYALMIHNIPIEYDALNDDYDDDLKDFLEKNAFPNKKLSIENVNLCYDLEELEELEYNKQNIIMKKQQFLKKRNSKKNNSAELTESDKNRLHIFDYKINQCKNRSVLLEYQFQDGKGKEFMKKYFAGYAFVTVETEQGIYTFSYLFFYSKLTEKEDIIKLYNDQEFHLLQKSNKSLIYHGNKLVIQQAPYPTDILWQNLKITNQQKRRRSIIGVLIMITMLSICFITIFGLQMVQRNLIGQESKSSINNQNGNQFNDQQRIKSQLISILISFVITIINLILRMVLNKISLLEGHPTVTQFYISAARKISLVQFFNSSLIIFIVQIYINFDGRSKFDRIYGVGGLIENQNYVFIFNMILPPIIEYTDIVGKIKSWKRKKEEKKGNKSFLTQKQLNTLYEDPQFNIPLRYSSLLNTMFMTSFYCPILPLSILYSIGSLLITYWIDKYNVLYRRTIKNSLGPELSIEMTEMIEFVLPIFSSSNLLFFLFITDYQTPAPKIAIAGICIGILNALLPMQFINEKLFYVKLADPNIQTYKEVEQTFKTTYQNENPATAHHGKKDFLQKYTMKGSPVHNSNQMSFYTEEQNQNQYNTGLSFPKKLPKTIFQSNKFDESQQQSQQPQLYTQSESTQQNQQFSQSKYQIQLQKQQQIEFLKDSILESKSPLSQSLKRLPSSKPQESQQPRVQYIQSFEISNTKYDGQIDDCIKELDNNLYPFMS